MPLYAGTFSNPPVRVEKNVRGQFRFLDADNQPCWTDPEHRVALYKIEHVQTVLSAHGYSLNDDMTVTKS